MREKTLLADPIAIELEYIKAIDGSITLVVKTRASVSHCPLCKISSSRIHSRYERQVADLPWQGVAVGMQLHTRRFFCDNDSCTRRIFCERLPNLVAPYARKTLRLNEALELIGFAIGGEAGARTAVELGMSVSPDTLIRRVRQAAQAQSSTPRVLGVDDWAFRRAKKYGTILVDLERRKIIDLLPDRDSETLANWLKKHTGIELIARDRSGSYAEGARTGAPNATQVADRWHLLKNLGETVERFLTSHNQYLRDAATRVINTHLNNSLSMVKRSTTMLSSRTEEEIQLRRQKRYARYSEVVKLYKDGLSILAISKVLRMSRMTVYKYVLADGFPERAPSRGHNSSLEPFKAYLNRRLAEGCNNISLLCREIIEQGYKGNGRMVRRYVERLRKKLFSLSPQEQIKILNSTDVKTDFKTPSTKRAAWWLMSEEKDLKEEEKLFIQQLFQLYPKTAKVQELARNFQKIIREHQHEKLDEWLASVDNSEIAELKGFAEALKREKAAVVAALQYKWSTSPVEGHINKLKMIKRQMFGRAKLDLLKARVLRYG